MNLAQAANGWRATRSALRLRRVEQQRLHQDRVEELRREVEALCALEAPLNVLYNNALDEWFAKGDAERVELLAEFRQKGEAHNKRRPRRRYYCVPDEGVNGRLTCKLFTDKPDHTNYLRVRAGSRTEARRKWDELGAAWARNGAAA